MNSWRFWRSADEPFNPELVITDVVKAGMNGVEMAIQVRQVRQLCPSCKILLFSGRSTVFSELNRATNRKAYAVQIS
jgi:two-component SAPR family response regulator